MINSKKILIIDDEEEIRNALGLLLIRKGYKVVEGGNGLHALQILRSGITPDLIICDFGMPGAVNGVQVLEFVRNQESLKFTPFIMLTGHSERELVISAGEAGVTYYVLKPFNTIEFLKKIESLIGSQADQEED